MDKRSLTERDICTKFILPAIVRAGWDVMFQVREEVFFTKGRITVRGKLVARGSAKKADFVLYFKPNLPIALIEAKDNSHAVGEGPHLTIGDETPNVFHRAGTRYRAVSARLISSMIRTCKNWTRSSRRLLQFSGSIHPNGMATSQI